MTKTRNIVTPYNVGMFCLGEDECITQGINFAAYERGVADAAEAFSMRTDGHLTAPDADAEISRLRDTQRVLADAQTVLVEALQFLVSGIETNCIADSDLSRARAALEFLKRPHSAQPSGEEVTARDAMRYRWLRNRLLAADFDWQGECVLVFRWPRNVPVGGNCDQNVDAAMQEPKP